MSTDHHYWEVCVDYTLKGRVIPLDDGSFEVDLRVTVDGEVPVARRKASSTVAAVPEEDYDELVSNIRRALGEDLSRLADEMVYLMARQNKSGKVALSRAYREVFSPLGLALGKIARDDMIYGMHSAIAKGIPNVNYAKRAAEGRNQQPVAAPVTNPLSRFDVIGGPNG